MRRYVAVLLVVLMVLPALAAQKKKKKPAAAPPTPTVVPVTSSSPEAKALFEKGMLAYESMKKEDAVVQWRAAAAKDPNLALAHLFVVELSQDPAEQDAEHKKAMALISSVTPDEQLMIRWLGLAQENQFVPAIAALNDLLAKYPTDKRLAFVAARWLRLQAGANERAMDVATRAVNLDPNYVPALNQLGYLYASDFQYDKALEIMKKYISLVPNEPNPPDSYAELSRKAGKYADALQYFQAALKIEPKFEQSLLGVAETYALMGDYENARSAYASAIDATPYEATKLQYRGQVALLSVRQKDYAAADKAYSELVDRAHTQGIGLVEAQLLRTMALYQRDDAAALALLDRAQKALNDHDIPKGDREGELADILRDRALRAAAAGQYEGSAAPVKELEAMAANSRNDRIQRAYHVAQGALLVASKKNGEALGHLYEDAWSPVSLKLQIAAFENMKATAEAQLARQKLANLHEPAAEYAVIQASFAQ